MKRHWFICFVVWILLANVIYWGSLQTTDTKLVIFKIIASLSGSFIATTWISINTLPKDHDTKDKTV